MKLADLLLLEKYLIQNVAVSYQTVFSVNIYTYTSIIIFMNQLTESFQTWKKIKERNLVYNSLIFLKILVKNKTQIIYRNSHSKNECLITEFLSCYHIHFCCWNNKVNKVQRENSSNSPLYTSTEYYHHGSDVPN